VVYVTNIRHIKNSPVLSTNPEGLANIGLEMQATGTKGEEEKAVSEGEPGLGPKSLRNWKPIEQTSKGARRQTG
jgi:hypothetical protein